MGDDEDVVLPVSVEVRDDNLPRVPESRYRASDHLGSAIEKAAIAVVEENFRLKFDVLVELDVPEHRILEPIAVEIAHSVGLDEKKFSAVGTLSRLPI